MQPYDNMELLLFYQPTIYAAISPSLPRPSSASESINITIEMLID